jgi:hypothetical protein
MKLCSIKTIPTIIALAVMLLFAPSACFALTFTVNVSKAKAKDLGMEVRSAGTNEVRVELEFKIDGALKDFSRVGSQVEVRIGPEKNPLLTAPLREDRSKPGRVVVSFSAARDQLGIINLWVTVPESDGRTIYILRVKDFVE